MWPRIDNQNSLKPGCLSLSHSHFLSLSFSIYLSLSLFISLSFYLSLSLSLSPSLTFYTSFFSLSPSLALSLSRSTFHILSLTQNLEFILFELKSYPADGYFMTLWLTQTSAIDQNSLGTLPPTKFCMLETWLNLAEWPLTSDCWDL